VSGVDPTTLIPQRPPFLMLDVVEEVSPTRVLARKTFSVDEPFYQGHFPGNPVTPGLFLCEAVHQAGAVLVAAGQGVELDGIPVLTRIYGTRLRGVVPPGSEVEVEVRLQEQVAGVYVIAGTVRLGDQVVLRHRVGLGMIVAGRLAAPDGSRSAAAG